MQLPKVIYDTVAELESLKRTSLRTQIIYCKGTESHYRLEPDGGSLTANGTTILDSAIGPNVKLVAIGGQYQNQPIDSVLWEKVTGKPLTFPPEAHTHAHSAATGQTANDHHNQSHTINGVDHTATGLTSGHVLSATGATTFAFGALQATQIPDLSGAYSVIGHGHSHTALSDVGTNAHSAIDTFIASKAGASGLASLDGSSLVVQNPANATATPTASKIVIADAGGKVDGWITSATTGALGLIKLANHLGGTALLPTVIGLTETGGPTSLIVGAIADGKFTKRSGSTFVGADIAYGDLPSRVKNHLWDTISLELNYYGTGDRYAVLDLHGDDTYTDFGARLGRNPGANASTDFTHRGTDGFRIIVQDAGYMGFYTNNTARAYVNSSGHLYAAANDTYTFGIAGTVWKEVRATDVYTHDGGVHTSDERKKEISGDLTLGLDFLMRLKPVQGKWKDYTETLEHVHPGHPIKTRDPKTGKVTLTPVADTIERVEVQRTFKRTHCWFVAQQVKQAIVDSGHSPDDIALWVKDINADEGLRYAEFGPIFAKALQEYVTKTDARLDKLEAA